MTGRSRQAQHVSLPPPAAGAMLVNGRYRVEAQLGRGGAASVFKAFEVATGRQVALKRLVKNASPRLSSLFELEYHTLASVKHESIVEVYDYGSDELGPYYVMELLEGHGAGRRLGRDARWALRALRTRCRAGQLPR